MKKIFNKRTPRKSPDSKFPANQLQQEILKMMQQHPKKRYNAAQMIRDLRVINGKDSVKHALEKLEKSGQLTYVGDEKFKLNMDVFKEFLQQNSYQGYVDMTQSGAAYIVCEGLENDIYVPAKFTNFALHGDLVRVSATIARGRKKADGEIIEILQRATDHFIGTLRLSRKYGLVLPDRLNMPTDIYIDLSDIKDARDGDKVVVKVTQWQGTANKSPIGEVTTVLGAVGSSDIEMKTILINNGFNLEFPEEVIRESEAISTKISDLEVARRRDMRGVTTFTIDPEDAKDFDDALSIQHLENGDIEIGIHIADVTHYVLPGTALDREAYWRSTSVYLVDRVLPMLPEKLSNELCSLRPHEDKLTFSAIFIFDKDSNAIKNRWFGKTIIHSNRRFSYEEAQDILNKKEGDLLTELQEMDRLARVLRAQRFKAGAINFESEEVKFRLDERGVPIEAYIKQRIDTNMLIEDFMLLANREVATFVAKKDPLEIPNIYRVHDTPDMAKVEDLMLFARALGFKISTDNPRRLAESYNQLADAIHENEALRVLGPLAIRTMAKAEYSSDNIGHYGLGFDNYTHFTSPIRRYSDVIAHRILEKNLGKNIFRTDKAELEEKCKRVSKQERKATDAERESIKYKQVEYIGNHLGKIFDGVVSGMIEKGVFVELLQNRCEGMVTFQSMREPFDMHPSRLSAVGQQSGRILKIGAAIKVKITGADLAKRQIEMVLV